MLSSPSLAVSTSRCRHEELAAFVAAFVLTLIVAFVPLAVSDLWRPGEQSSAEGGDGITLSYDMGCVGLSFDEPTRTLSVTRTGFAVSGTPSVTQTAKTYTWTATDADGDTVTA